MAAQENQGKKRHPKPKQKPVLPIEAAITAWASNLPSGSALGRGEVGVAELAAQAPKRWTVYEPMVLLPSGSFATSAWTSLKSTLSSSQLDDLWLNILSEISRKSGTSYTHLAVNEGIPLHLREHDDSSTAENGNENILRSPSGLQVLYGNFGKCNLSSATDLATESDFEAAFWVSTKQNGIYQTWAPRWTMFSRGNIKEKARVLSFHQPTEPALQHRAMNPSALRDKWAVDMYAGIGYFVFSYAKLGMRVLCWELNPWSVEGLRRGAVANGWSVRVIRGDELTSDVDLGAMIAGDTRIVVFQEDNAMALQRIQQARQKLADHQHGLGSIDEPSSLDVLHVNCGFLPTSEPCWKDAITITQDSPRAWLHLHENVGVADIEKRKTEIGDKLTSMVSREDSPRAPAAIGVEHVELVKTYAPGVWHCVFDSYSCASESA
ncbi:S-adenosyl-L-methionine-dependent methyltransferase [Apiospora kogelbergensis]|uniref:S-adenosyl-L-methionine-dependent methyltransferase n=1 Tax=Apiospora kogelbergensis TaxID=1337665 RepID=UPI00312F4F76